MAPKPFRDVTSKDLACERFHLQTYEFGAYDEGS